MVARAAEPVTGGNEALASDKKEEKKEKKEKKEQKKEKKHKKQQQDDKDRYRRSKAPSLTRAQFESKSPNLIREY